MPLGLISDVCALIIGGLVGGIIGKLLSDSMKDALNTIFGICAMAIGIRLIVGMNNLSAVVLSVVLGTVIGEITHLEHRVNVLATKATTVFLKNTTADDSYINIFCAVAVVFCCSGTGWYGVLIEGFAGDSSILITKAIMDFFTAIIFAAVLGRLVSTLAVPQLLIYIVLFTVSKLVVPYTSAEMIADFSAVAGIVEVATGLRIAGVKRDIRVINSIPAMIIAMPISALWTYFSGV
ncbi:MAG: DUF554 domain-containing protein [Lachnospiraceae bacterium]|nr:DUF554 domain-containing protein [Lachnospiraceae bacterium]